MVWLVYWSDTSRNLTASAVIRTARASELLVRLGMPTKLTEVASGGGFPGGPASAVVLGLFNIEFSGQRRTAYLRQDCADMRHFLPGIWAPASPSWGRFLA